MDVNAKGKGEEEEYATCQMMVSWPYSGEAADEMPETQTARRERIRQLAMNWNETFRDLVYSIPETTELREIVLEDWPPVQGRWDNHNGRVTLVGDAAHCMTMCKSQYSHSSFFHFSTTRRRPVSLTISRVGMGGRDLQSEAKLPIME